MRVPHMVAACVAAAAVAGCAGRAEPHDRPAPGTAGSDRPGPLQMRDGDTLVVFVHRVRADQQEAYRQWMRDWDEAATRAAARYPQIAEVHARRRRFVPADQPDDSVATFAYLYPYILDYPSRRPGLAGMLEASGLPDSEIEERMERFRGLTYGTEVLRLVQGEL